MIKKKKSVLTIFMILSITFIFLNCEYEKYVNEISRITFTYEHSKNFRDARYKIELFLKNDSIVVNVFSLNEDSVINRIILRDKNIFINLVNGIKKINSYDFFSENSIELDGNSCELKYGNASNSISYKVWSPDYQTDKRRLQNYLNICKKIVTLSQINNTVDKIIFN